ncbi:uncharacterized protein LOC142356548 [Convolutriloba macropyga]|uniref:uncharacterized protein LOC142356548 n=1 Tax=Convolutriloba macropyga TaxID=536237 RepID=UPI003F526540
MNFGVVLYAIYTVLHFVVSASVYPSENWESLQFKLPTDLNYYGRKCRQYSQYYCLDKYETQFQEMHSEWQVTRLKKTEKYYEQSFKHLIVNYWKDINMIDQYRTDGCCDLQASKYLLNGYLNKRMTPAEYLDKIADYSNDNINLNSISAFYWSKICMNVILGVGFGPGPLMRENILEEIPNAPYIFPGQEFSQSIGIPGIPSAVFGYVNPGVDLTFHWFKVHIMCKDNPWICERNRTHFNRSPSWHKNEFEDENGNNDEMKTV